MILMFTFCFLPCLEARLGEICPWGFECLELCGEVVVWTVHVACMG